MIATAIRDDCSRKRVEYKELKKQGRVTQAGDEAATRAAQQRFHQAGQVWKLHTADKKNVHIFPSKHDFSAVLFFCFRLYRSASER